MMTAKSAALSLRIKPSTLRRCEREAALPHLETYSPEDVLRVGRCLPMILYWDRDIRIPPTGFVYFIEANYGAIKVGYSSSPSRRIGEISGQGLRILAQFRGWRSTESTAHGAFRDCRIEGEWFEPHADLKSLINFCRSKDGLPPADFREFVPVISPVFPELNFPAPRAEVRP